MPLPAQGREFARAPAAGFSYEAGMESAHLGQLAAFGTALCWSVTALSFETAGKRVGSVPVNVLRLAMGFGFLLPLVWLRRGMPFPMDAPGSAWLWLGVSGAVGFAFGDLCLFRAFVMIGARLSVLLMSLVPPMTALLSWAVLGETLTPREWVGMGMTIAGIMWVVRERIPSPDAVARHPSLWGLLLAMGGALGQAVGLVLSKFGMADYDPFAANQIRILAGLLTFAVLFTATRAWPRVARAVRDGRAMVYTAVGGFFGPFLGVSLSLVAVQHARAGIAATIMSVTPITIIPLAIWLRNERATPRAILGAGLAVAGTAVMLA